MADRLLLHRIFLLGIVLLVLMIVTTGPLARVPVAHAQGDDPQIIRSHDAEVVFPAAIRFPLRLLVPTDELSSLSLTISQGEQILGEGEVDIAAAVELSDDLSAPRFDWPIPTTGSPTLFAPTTYRWTLTFNNGEVYEFEGEFIFADEGQPWRHAGEAPLSLSTFEDVAINRSREMILPAYDLLSAHTGLEPDFQWIILPRQHTFCVEQENIGASVVLAADGTAYPCNETRAERFFTGERYRLLRREMPGLIALQNELITDMFSVFYGDYWGDAAVPTWFRAGLPQLYGISPDLSALRRMQNAARQDGLLESYALNAAPDANTEARIIWNNQVYTMTLYLADLYGADAPFDLARAVPETGFERAFRDLTNSDLDDFLLDWARWLFSDEAERAVAWTVYLATTATLPPTNTQTPVPPTSTITPTATDTPLPTSTPTATGIVQQQPSPLPTFTPAPPTLSIPTNTPRPPGSLDQPSEQGSGDSGGGGLCPASLPALVLPAAALVLTQRRKKHR